MSKPVFENGPQPTEGHVPLQQHEQQQGQGRRSPASAAVETVLQFGYPQRLVTSTFRELCAASKVAPPSDVQEGKADGRIKAVELLKAVEVRLKSSVAGTAGASSAAWLEDHATETGSEDDHDDEWDDTLPALTPASDSRDDLSRSGHKPGTESTARRSPDLAAANSAVRDARAAPVATAATESATVPSERGWSSRKETLAASQGGVPGSLQGERGTSHETLLSVVSNLQAETVPANLSPRGPTTHGAPPIPASSAARRADPATPSGAGREATSGGDEAKAGRHADQLRALRVENRRLKARSTCRHCRQRPASLTLLPCGHFCFCYECGSSFRSCPVCRKTILADVRTFVA